MLRKDAFVWAIAALTFLLHLAVAGRYDFFRNELYSIVCGRAPAFGYADQPPLVPLVAAATQIFGLHLWLLRLPAALAAAALVPLTAGLSRLLGGTALSAVMAGLAAAISPALIALTGILTTSSFEPLAWTACAYFVARAVVLEDRRALVWAGVVAGVALEAKYGILVWLAGIGLGLLAGSERRVFGWRHCWVGVGIGVAIAAPSLVWQTLHDWPFLAVIGHHAKVHSNFTGTPLRFEILQAVAINLVLAPLWIYGLVAPFVEKAQQPARFLAIAYVVAAAITIMGQGKDYYLFPAYPALFAIGAAACAQLPRMIAGGWMVLATANAALLAPIVLPLLDPPALAAYMAKLHIHPPPDEAAAVGAPLTQVFSDELGWRSLEKSVADAYRALPAEDRQHAAIIASNYGEAAAIDVYGRDDKLPPALSGQDQYYFWGPRGYDGSVVLHINADPEHWRHICATVDILGQFGAPYVMPYENNRPVFVCRGLHVGLAEAWPHFKRLQ